MYTPENKHETLKICYLDFTLKFFSLSGRAPLFRFQGSLLGWENQMRYTRLGSEL